jgi:hypothetical protein
LVTTSSSISINPYSATVALGKLRLMAVQAPPIPAKVSHVRQTWCIDLGSTVRENPSGFSWTLQAVSTWGQKPSVESCEHAM